METTAPTLIVTLARRALASAALAAALLLGVSLAAPPGRRPG